LLFFREQTTLNAALGFSVSLWRQIDVGWFGFFFRNHAAEALWLERKFFLKKEVEIHTTLGLKKESPGTFTGVLAVGSERPNYRLFSV
jgi:hypothetical protein